MITKTVRLTGSSAATIEEAIAGVLGRAAETLQDIQNFTVVDIAGTVDPSGIVAEYRVTLDITFVVKESTTHG
jgi:flavin-binding protein dodecin